MFLRGIGDFNQVKNSNVNASEVSQTKLEDPVFELLNSRTNHTGKKNNPYREFNKALEDTSLGDKFLSGDKLEAKGYKKEEYFDKNGGYYYTNTKTGETIRVMSRRLFSPDIQSTMQSETDKMSHFVIYDSNGNATGGKLQVKQPDGSIKVYDYGVDINGNKFIKSIEVHNDGRFSCYE